MYSLRPSLKIIWTLVFVLVANTICHAQLLDKVVTIEAKRQPVGDVLKTIGKQAGFYFSYNSNIIKKDSLVTISAKQKTVRTVLDELFNGAYEYTETGNHVIIEHSSGPYWYVSGYIIDEVSGQKIRGASVYEKRQLASTLTNDEGYYRLKLREKYPTIMISVSKSWYLDREIVVKPGVNQEVNVSIKPQNFELDSVVINQYSDVEKNWFGNFFLSSKQKMQSLNLGKFFVDKPFQTSFIPGLSTHGKMGSQVVNQFSFNVIGGYTAGVDGFELGSVFNIVKKDVKYVQIGGAVNLVGGTVKGLQIAGVGNSSLDSVNGWQFAGFANLTGKAFSGMQLAGFYNHVSEDAKGLQLSGFGNYVQKSIKGMQLAGFGNLNMEEVKGVQLSGFANIGFRKVKGFQLAGFSNFCLEDVKGVQLSGFLNVAKAMNGFQLGIINYADTSAGYSLGLLNIVRKNGYHRISISANELNNLNVEVKTGNKKLYSILIGGMNLGTEKMYAFGLGFGTERALNKTFSLNPEISTRYLYPGGWEYLNMIHKVSLNLNVKLNPYISFFAGPSYNVYWTQGMVAHEGYKTNVAAMGYANTRLFNNSNSFFGWVGGNVGISIF